MKLKTLYCPSCGGNVNFDFESGKKSFYCMHCGAQIFIDDEIVRTEHREYSEQKIDSRVTYFDESRIKELELKHQYEEDARSNRIATASGCALAAILPIIMLIGTISSIIGFLLLLVTAGLSSCGVFDSDIWVLPYFILE